MEIEPFMFTAIVVGSLIAGFAGAVLLCAWPDKALKQQLDDARITLAQRESHIETMSRTHMQERKALLEKIEVHPVEDGACRTIPRDRRTVAELLTQRRRKRQAEEEKTFDEVYKPMMDTDQESEVATLTGES